MEINCIACGLKSNNYGYNDQFCSSCRMIYTTSSQWHIPRKEPKAMAKSKCKLCKSLSKKSKMWPSICRSCARNLRILIRESI